MKQEQQDPPETVHVGHRGTRRSTISTITHDLRQSIMSVSSAIEKQVHSYNASIVALCSCVLTMFYLLMNCFPYSGFMAMQLVPGLTLESAGTYAGILSSSFMVGRALSSYPWGKLADVYGRKFVLVCSLINSAIFSLAFGFSPTFSWAVASRFLMGLGNGTMLIARTSISELARGDHELESRGMGLIMSMVGYGMLIAPSLGGALSEPMTQFPDAHWFGGRFDHILTEFPFILPNLVAVLLSLISLVLVIVSIEETLPVEKRRDTKHLVPDTCRFLMIAPGAILGNLNCWSRDSTHYEQISTAPPSEDDNDGDSVVDDLHILDSKDCSELSALLSSPASRTSYSTEMHRPSSQQQGPSVGNANIQSLMSNKSTRDCLIAYWLNCFVNVALNEAFPLFCMSKQGGLGLSETQIGVIGTAAGLLFCICQYFIFSYGMKTFGLRKSLVYSSLLSNAPAILFPLSLLYKGTLGALIFLSVLMAVLMIFNSVFYAAMTIATNRTVEASHRATLNGLSSVGASVGRGCGPLFAGSLVAFAMSSGIFPARFGSVVVYSVLALLGMVAFAATQHLKPEEIPPATDNQEKEGGGIEIEGMDVVAEDEEKG